MTGNLIIPNSVTSIGEFAFNSCGGFIGGLVIPNSVTEIGVGAFGGAGFDGELVISNNLTTIEGGVFVGCGFTGELVIPNSVTSIEGSAFEGCSGFTGNLIIPNTINTIHQSTFARCSGFTGCLEIPNSVTRIESMAFYGCNGISCISIPSTVLSIGGNVFTETGWYNAQSDGILYFGDWCLGYKGASPIGILNIQEGTKGIAGWAFDHCSDLTGVLTIPESIERIGEMAFVGCSGITELHYNAINCNYDYAMECFTECSGLNTLVIGDNVTTIPSYIFLNLGFSGNLVIPNSVTTIGTSAFEGCSNLTGNLFIPNSVTTIEGWAFYNCSGFTGDLTIPNTVTYLGISAFYGCSGLASVTIGNSVTSIGGGAFYGCNGLTSATIGNSVASIGISAFRECSNLSSMRIYAVIPPTLGIYNGTINVFTNVDKSIPVYVPYGTVAAYQAAPGWNEFTNYQEIAFKSISGYSGGNVDWQFVASPLAESTAPTAIDDMLPAAGTYDLYRFDQTENAEWRNYKANNFTLTNGQGYLYANVEDVNLIFKGEFNEDETKEVGLTFDANATFAGWNLVGNPFPVSAYANRSYYVMNEDGTAIEPVAVSMETAIPACTGVMVKADAAGETVTFSKTAPDAAVNQGVLQIALSQVVEPVVVERGQSVETPVYRGDGPSTSSGTLTLDKAIVSFNANDRLEKFVFNKNNATLSIPQSGKDLAIVCAERVGEMTLNFKAIKNGKYTITVNPEAVEMDYLHLVDNMTGNDIDLLASPSYSFNAKTTYYASRFRLVFSVCGDADGDNENAPFAYIHNGEIVILADVCDASLQVVDVTGRVVFSCHGDAINRVSTSGMTTGVYVLRLLDGNDMKTQKIVIR